MVSATAETDYFCIMLSHSYFSISKIEIFFWKMFLYFITNILLKYSFGMIFFYNLLKKAIQVMWIKSRKGKTLIDHIL